MPDLHLRLDSDTDDSASTGRTVPVLDVCEAIQLLEHAEITSEALVPWGSNYTFAVALQDPESGAVVQFGIYKPVRGERPLWDFPHDTLYQRERASWLLSDLLGWGIVPPTVIRDGPHGVGSLQLYVEPGEEMDRRQALEFWGRCIPEMERMVVFDMIANNADRKLTHCLLDIHGNIWGIDHGLTFNVVTKLRTVLWQFVGDPVSIEILGDIARVREDEETLRDRFRDVLDDTETQAMIDRMDVLLATGRHPELDPNLNVPYGWW